MPVTKIRVSAPAPYKNPTVTNLHAISGGKKRGSIRFKELLEVVFKCLKGLRFCASMTENTAKMEDRFWPRNKTCENRTCEN